MAGNFNESRFFWLVQDGNDDDHKDILQLHCKR